MSAATDRQRRLELAEIARLQMVGRAAPVQNVSSRGEGQIRTAADHPADWCRCSPLSEKGGHR